MTASSAMMILAAAEAAPQQSPLQQVWGILPLILMVIAMFVFMSSSQRKRTKQQEQLIKNLKSGDKVSTTSGIIGTVVTVKDRSISIRSEDSKFEVLKSAVTEVLERKGEPAEAKERKAEPAEAKP